MTTTSQEQGKDVGGSEPVQKSEPKAEQQGVPVGEHVELRQELRQAKERLAQLESELTKKKTPIGDDLAEQVRQIRERQRVTDLVADLGLADQKQGKAVLDLLAENPGLKPAEAHMLAKARTPDVFNDTAQPGGFDPAIHGSRRPQSSGIPQEPKVDERKKRLDAIKGLLKTDKMRATDIAMNWLGHLAAQKAGKTNHKLIDL